MDHFCSRPRRCDGLISHFCSCSLRPGCARRDGFTPSARAGRSLSPPLLSQTRRLPAFCFVLLFAASSFAAGLPRPDTSDAALKADTRLGQALTVRVSRMPLSDLLERVGAAVDVRLIAEGEDVAEQKIDLCATDLPAAQILTAITGLLNSEGPKGYRWERSGSGPNFRYVLVRDLASRQWEAKQAAAAAARLTGLLRARLRALGHEPFTPGPDRPREVPAMRKFLAGLSDDQLAQLASQRFLRLTAFWERRPAPIWKELSDQAVEAARSRDPERVQEKLRPYAPADFLARTDVQIRLGGDPARYVVRMAVRTPGGGAGMAEVCSFSDPVATLDRPTPPVTKAPGLPPLVDEATFALPPRSFWLMGDVLLDLAARGNVNLIADDYTVNWAELRSLRTAQPLAVWLAAIQEQYGFAVVRDGAFLRLRNRRWWYDRGREIPQSLLTRWAQLSAGMPEDRLQAAVEIAEWAPLNAGSLPPYYLRLGRLADTPEIKELSTEATDPGEAEVAPGFTQVVIDAQTELRIYARLTARQQQTVRGEGLTLSWQEMPSQARDLFAHRIRTFWEPGIDAGHLRQSSLWMQFQNDEIVFRYGISGVPHDRAFKFAAGQGYIHRFVPAHPARGNALVGSPAPELLYEDASGKRISLQPHGPLLVYVAPAWPRPAVARQEDFADLKALQQTSAPAAGTEARVLVLGADATAAELRGWWKVRGFDLPPLAITIDTARRLGVRGQPVAFIVDRGGRVAWVKEGYTPGDEAVWRRELARVGDVPGD